MADAKSRHLVIAGTGRAGTSFLVEYLAAVGMDTHLAKYGAAATKDPNAHAGHEDLLLPGAAGFPYVVKSPWTHELVDELLERDDIGIDGVIIPVRNLVQAAASRVILEQRAMAELIPAMSSLKRSWSHFGLTPGGVVYSLDPLDQARVLAVGFHHLIERLVSAEIPICFLHFPRFVTDADYIYDHLRRWLPPDLGLAEARLKHQNVSDRSKLRVENELASSAPTTCGTDGSEPTIGDLDRVALGREIERLRTRLMSTEQARASLESANAILQTDYNALQHSQIELVAQSAAAVSEAKASSAELDTTRSALSDLRDQLHSVSDSYSSTCAVVQSLREVNDAFRVELSENRERSRHDERCLSACIADLNDRLSRERELSAQLREKSEATEWLLSVLKAAAMRRSRSYIVRIKSIVFGWFLHRKYADLFDRSWYLERYTDVLVSGIDPLYHFLNFGYREGRDPSPRFSCAAYTEANPDVARMNVNPLAHYVRRGRAEGRSISSLKSSA